MWKLLLLSLTWPSVAIAQQASLQQLEALMRKAVNTTGPVEVALVNRDSIRYLESFGKSASEAHPQRIYAASQWLAAATLLTLVDEGRISLDEPVSRHIKQLKNERDQITLRQLLTHTSGLPANSIYIMDTTLSLQRSVTKALRHARLVALPGTQFIYGHISYQVAGRLAEVITGKDWETIFQEKIAIPCGMTHTTFGSGRSVHVAEGAISTAADFVNFLRMILNKGQFNGRQILSENAVDAMLRDYIRSLEVGYTPYHFKAAKLSDYYGLGVWINRISITDSTTTEVSCRGGNGFTAWINLCTQTGGVLGFDSDMSLAEPIIREAKVIVDAITDKDCADTEPAPRPFSRIEELTDSPHLVHVLVQVEEDAPVSLRLFDLLGNELQVLINGPTKAGAYMVPINTALLPPGVYFYRLSIGDKVETKKIKVKK
ncbi:MAG: hypothetical protein KatS3mg031_2740 [Chitinophagales bacterium]|nr:MAG: hypothetical protein KatS3mg031_2740 [Chitinophagales bacterium]